MQQELQKKLHRFRLWDASRGGLSTKIHAGSIDENCAVALSISSGDAHDGRQFESLYESLDQDNLIEAACLDRGYDADRIRNRLLYDGIEPVIPSISTRSIKPPFDALRYKQRNRIERFFSKIKHFRRNRNALRQTRFELLCCCSLGLQLLLSPKIREHYLMQSGAK